MKELSKLQRQAATTLDRGVSLIAAAGSGKTSVLVERYLSCLATGAGADSILAVTFTREAAAELRHRILQRIKDQSPQAEWLIDEIESTQNIGTIHRFCMTVIEQFASRIGLPQVTEILDERGQVEKFERLFQTHLTTLDTGSLHWLLERWTFRALRELYKQIQHQRFQLRTANSDDQEIRQTVSLAHRFFEQWQNELIQDGKYSFDDLESAAHLILTTLSEAGDWAQRRFKYLLIDEFQDTSRRQWEVLQQVFGQTWQRLFIVGDPRQSIYRFRDADPRIFAEATEHVLQNGGVRIELSDNYRSRNEILDGVNSLSPKLFAESNDLSPLRSAGKSPVSLPDAGFQVHRYSSQRDGRALRAEERREMELEITVNRVREYLAQGHSPASIAILFRASEPMQAYRSALEGLGLEIRIQKSRRIFDSYDCLDLFHFFQAIALQNRDTLQAFLRSRFIGLSPSRWSEVLRSGGVELDRLLSKKGELSWLGSLFLNPPTTAAEALDVLISNSRHWPSDREGFLCLLEGTHQETLGETFQRLQLWKEQEVFRPASEERSPHALPLMTVHAAKGLEFDSVILTDCLRRSPPAAPWLHVSNSQVGMKLRREKEYAMVGDYGSLQLVTEKEELREGYRLLYVALTRARHRIDIVIPQSDPKKPFPEGTWAWALSGLESTAISSNHQPLRKTPPPPLEPQPPSL